MPDSERMKEVDQEGYNKYLGILQLDKTINKEMKENIGNEDIRTLLNAGNFISGFNAWAIFMRYSKGIIDWTKEELQDMDQRTRNIMTDFCTQEVVWQDCI